MKDKLSRLVVT